MSEPGVPAGSRLAALAAAHRVATSYQDWAGRPVPVSARTVRAVLEALGVDPAGPPPEPAVPATVVFAQSAGARLAATGGAELVLEDGSRRSLGSAGAPLALPPGLPTGYHRLELAGGGSARVIVAPDRLPALPGRIWGWMLQLYALRSAASWGIGDCADLATVAERTGRQGADLLVVNPLDAVALVPPIQPSPYYPSSRRVPSPLYLRPELLAGYRQADPSVRARVDALAARAPRGERIDRDAVWAAKAEALALLGPPPGAPPPPGPIADVARFCAVAERHGPDWRRWPAGAERDADPARLAWHGWLCAETKSQLTAAQRAATAGGMRVGIVHDLPVGVDPGGADAWTLRDVLAGQVTVGAPPDSFNQQGQDWQLPPWQPGALAAAGYEPFREVVAATVCHGGGIRVDHVMGLFRLWWIPPGFAPADGTYVGYDPAAMLGVLSLEAARAGALVIGEDLGTVEPAVGEALADRGVLGSTVAWFAEGEPAAWRRDAAASVTTHDLPTAAGFLAGEHVRVRAELALLGRSAEQEHAAWEAERDALLARVAALGYDPADAVAGLHALLVASPARVVLASLPDAVGDRRQPNLPGTTKAYPNWQLPVAGPDGRERGVEALLADPGFVRLGRLIADGLGADGRGPESEAPEAGTAPAGVEDHS